LLLIIFTIANKNLYVAYVIFMLSGIIIFFYPNKNIRKGCLPISLLIGTTFFGNLFFSPGKVVLDMKIIFITDTSLNNAILRASKITALIIGTKLFILSYPSEDIILSIKRLLTPLKKLKLPIDEFFEIILMTLNKVSEIKENIINIYNNIKEGNLLKKATLVVYILLSEEIEKRRYDN